MSGNIFRTFLNFYSREKCVYGDNGCTLTGDSIPPCAIIQEEAGYSCHKMTVFGKVKRKYRAQKEASQRD